MTYQDRQVMKADSAVAVAAKAMSCKKTGVICSGLFAVFLAIVTATPGHPQGAAARLLEEPKLASPRLTSITLYCSRITPKGAQICYHVKKLGSRNIVFTVLAQREAGGQVLRGEPKPCSMKNQDFRCSEHIRLTGGRFYVRSLDVEFKSNNPPTADIRRMMQD